MKATICISFGNFLHAKQPQNRSALDLEILRRINSLTEQIFITRSLIHYRPAQDIDVKNNFNFQTILIYIDAYGTRCIKISILFWLTLLLVMVDLIKRFCILFLFYFIALYCIYQHHLLRYYRQFRSAVIKRWTFRDARIVPWSYFKIEFGNGKCCWT